MKDLVQAADFRPDINALRAFAVLAVVAYHYGMPGRKGVLPEWTFFLSSRVF